MKSKTRAQPINRQAFTTQIASILSLLSSIIIAGILSFFVDTLRREYMPVPWPILLVMSTSCLSVTSLLAVSFTRCYFPSSPQLCLVFHLPIAILWVVTLALLGDELGDHLTASCPLSDTFGHELSLVFRLFKAIFSFTVFSTACSVYLVIIETLTWRRLKKIGKYTAMDKNSSAMSRVPPLMDRLKRRQMFTALFRRKGNGIQEDERGEMMQLMDVDVVERGNDMLKPSHARGATARPVSSPVSTF